MYSKLYKDLLQQLETTQGQKVFFWGASIFLKDFLQKYPLEQYNIKGIIDCNPFKWKEMYCGYNIISPDELKNEEGNVTIIFTIKNSNRQVYNEIKKYIRRLDYENKTVLLPNIFINNNYSSNNNIYIIKDGIKKKVDSILGLDIQFDGNNNNIEIQVPFQFYNSKITLESGCNIKIGPTKHFCQNMTFRCKNNSQLLIGSDYSMCGGHIIMDEDLIIKIGNDCMFSAQIYIRAGDGHTIYENTTKEILNKPEKDCITIGNHVWLGSTTTILKNTKIANNTVVARKAVVTKNFNEEFVVIAGNPAKVIKSGINWSRKRISEFEKALTL